MPEKSLFNIANEVEDEESFLNFIGELVKDRKRFLRGEKVTAWQNDTIEYFFICARAWAEASKDGLMYYEKPNNPWKRCAQIIYMGKIYE